jgi:hypothetical protein
MNTTNTTTISPLSIVTCSRCPRKTQVRHGMGWNMTTTRGAVTAVTCPACQSADENAEAATTTLRRTSFEC